MLNCLTLDFRRKQRDFVTFKLEVSFRLYFQSDNLTAMTSAMAMIISRACASFMQMQSPDSTWNP